MATFVAWVNRPARPQCLMCWLMLLRSDFIDTNVQEDCISTAAKPQIIATSPLFSHFYSEGIFWDRGCATGVATRCQHVGNSRWKGWTVSWEHHLQTWLFAAKVYEGAGCRQLQVRHLKDMQASA